MQRCTVSFFIPGKVQFKVQAGEEETAEELIQQLSSGHSPTWLETLVLDSLRIEDIEIDSVDISGPTPRLEEELDFYNY